MGGCSLKNFCAEACLQDVQARQFESRGDFGVAGEAIFLGLLGHQLEAHQALPDSLAILGDRSAAEDLPSVSALT